MKIIKRDKINYKKVDYHSVEFANELKTNGNKFCYKYDYVKFICMLVIFACVSFMMLFFLLNTFDFSLRIFTIRVWQYILAFFSGGALGVAGFLLQKMTRNNLADVSILGIGSLNVIFISLYIFNVYNANAYNDDVIRKTLPIIAISSSLLGTVIIYFLSKIGKKSSDRFIIIGIALQFLFEAISIAIINPTVNNAAPGSAFNLVITEIQNFTLGRFPDVQKLAQNINWRILTILSAVVISVIVGIVWLLRRKIDVLEANEKLAVSYGIKVEWLKFFLYIFVALLAGLESTMVGTIALLGVLAPNFAKLLFGNRSSTNIFASFLIGGILVIFASFISVNLATNIPIGFLSTAIIAPYFIYLILRKK